MLEVVTMKEIDAIFAVTDALGIHREMLVIPLGPATPGRVAELKRLDSSVNPTTSANSKLACWKLSAIGDSPASLSSAIDGGST